MLLFANLRQSTNGTCNNRLNIRRDALEASMLSGIRTHLMEPELFKEFCEEFTREMNRLRIERSSDIIGKRKELEKIQRDLERAVQAILDGVPGAQLKDKIGGLEARKAELAELLANSEEPPPLLHPNMAEIYRQRISVLYERLQEEGTRAGAAEIFRTLIDRVTLQPDEQELTIVLRGDLAAILAFAANKKKPSLLSEAGLLAGLISPVSLVAGTRNTRYLRLVEGPIPKLAA